MTYLTSMESGLYETVKKTLMNHFYMLPIIPTKRPEW